MTRQELNIKRHQVTTRIQELRAEQSRLDISETSLASDEQYSSMLDECYDEVDVCGYKYDPSHALRLLDPTAYRCGFVDWLDSLDIENSDEWQELENQIEELDNELEELEETE